MFNMNITIRAMTHDPYANWAMRQFHSNKLRKKWKIPTTFKVVQNSSAAVSGGEQYNCVTILFKV